MWRPFLQIPACEDPLVTGVFIFRAMIFGVRPRFGQGLGLISKARLTHWPSANPKNSRLSQAAASGRLLSVMSPPGIHGLGLTAGIKAPVTSRTQGPVSK